MIVAAGLSPAWQQILSLDTFRPGEVNRARAAHWCGSGKVLNVGLALHHLCGGRADATLTLSPLAGLAKQFIEDEFAALNIPRHWISTVAHTRVCTTILDSATGTTTELVENAGPISPAELAAFEEAFAEAVECADAVVLTGSLPAGTPADFFRRLLSHVSCLAVLDIRGPEVLAALDARPIVVKPNREELAHTLGGSIATDAELKAAIAELQRRGAQWVVVSAGGGDTMVGAAGDFFRIRSLPVPRVVNPIGCGDCLAAGIAWALGQGREPLAAIRHGIAAAAENVGTLLPARLDPQRVIARAAEVVVERI